LVPTSAFKRSKDYPSYVVQIHGSFIDYVLAYFNYNMDMGEVMKDKLNCASIVGKPNFAVAHENVKPVDKMIFFKGGRQLGKSYHMRGVVEDLLKIQDHNSNKG
jgi:hypothetical protein|tara:strand:+ start:1690 stop:2001 length:312 start_codon:yes stop_codon:yes gene_type:complete